MELDYTCRERRPLKERRFKRVTQLSGWFRTQPISAQRVSYVTEPNATKLDNCWSSQTFYKNATFRNQLFVPLIPERTFGIDVPKWPTFWPTFCFLSPRDEVLGVPNLLRTYGLTDGRTYMDFLGLPAQKPLRGKYPLLNKIHPVVKTGFSDSDFHFWNFDPPPNNLKKWEIWKMRAKLMEKFGRFFFTHTIVFF